MAARFRVGASGAVWNLTSGWSASSGGAPGASVPVAGDNATFDVNSPASTIMNRAEACATVTITAAKTLACSGYSLTCSGAIIMTAGTLLGNASTVYCVGLAVSGSGKLGGVGNFITISNGGALSLTGAVVYEGVVSYIQTASATTWLCTGYHTWYAFTINSGVTVSHTTSATLVVHTLRLTLNGVIDTTVGGNNLELWGNTVSASVGVNADVVSSASTWVVFALANPGILSNSKTSAWSIGGECWFVDQRVLTGNFSSANILLYSYVANNVITWPAGTLQAARFRCYCDVASRNITLDCATNNPTMTISGDVDFHAGPQQSYNTYVSMGNGTWTVGGSWDHSLVTTFVANSSTLYMNGVSGTLTGASTKLLYNLTTSVINSCTVAGTTYASHTVTINGTVTIGSGLGFGVSGASSDLQVAGIGTITGAGNVAVNAGTLSQMDGAITVSGALRIYGAVTYVDPASYGCIIEFINVAAGVVTSLPAGGHTFTGLKLTHSSAGSMEVDLSAATVTLTGALTATNTGGGTLTLDGAAVLNTSGNVSFANITTYTRGTGTINLTGVSGPAIQVADFNGKSIENLVINNGVGVVNQFAAGSPSFSALSYTFTAGTVDNDTNNPSYVVEGPVSFASSPTAVYTKGTGSITYTGTGGGPYLIALGNQYVEAITVSTTTSTREFSGTFTTAGFTIVAGSAVDMSVYDPEYTVQGNISFADSTYTFGAGSITVDTTGTNTIDFGNNIVGNLVVTGSDTAVFSANGVSSFSFTASSTVTIDNSVNDPDWVIATTVQLASGVTWTRGAGTITLTGAGPLSHTIDFNGKVVEPITVSNAGVTKQFVSSVVTYGFTTSVTADVDMGTYNPNWEVRGNILLSNGTYSRGTGTLTVTTTGMNTIEFGNNPVDNLSFGGSNTAVVSANGVTAYGVATTSTVTVDNSVNDPDWNISGDIALGASATWTKGDGTITLTGAGSGTQTIDFGSQDIEDLVVDDSGAVKQITASFTADSLLVSAGTFDPNTKIIDTVGNTLFDTGGLVGDPIGSTFNVGGDFEARGTYLKASGAWFLNVTGTAAASDVDVRLSDASGGSTVYASSVDWGLNVNWVFSHAVYLGLVNKETGVGLEVYPTLVTENKLLLDPTSYSALVAIQSLYEVATTSTLVYRPCSQVVQTASGITTSLWATPDGGNSLIVKNTSSGSTTIDGNGETIESASTLTLMAGAAVSLLYDGSEWKVTSGGTLITPQLIMDPEAAAGVTPVDTDVSSWGDDTFGIVIGTGGRVFATWKNSTDVYYVELTNI